MKKTLFLLCMLLIATVAYSQTPQLINYQAALRNADGTTLTNSTVGVRFTIRQTTENGTPVYVEEQTVPTNEFGLINTQIGTGTTNDQLSNVNWGNDSYFLQVEVDPNGETNYQQLADENPQLISVPYALHARTVEMDADSQQLGLIGDSLFLSNGGHVILQNFTDTDDQSIQGSNLNGTDLFIGIEDGTGETVDLSSLVDNDADSTNELQNLSINGDTLFISGGNFVVVSNVGAPDEIVDNDGDTKVQVEESNDEDYIRFDTEGFERMTIEPLGDVGIGTINPNHRFEIDESTALDNRSGQRIEYTYSGTSTTSLNAGLLINSDGPSSGRTYGLYSEVNNIATAKGIAVQAVALGPSIGDHKALEGNAIGTAGINYALFANAQDGATNWAGWFNAGDVHIADNLLIGTSSNAGNHKARIEFNSFVNSHLNLHESEDDYARLSFSNTTTTNEFKLVGKPAAIDANAQFNVFYSGVGDILQVWGTGNVGIGTVNPPVRKQQIHAFSGDAFTKYSANNIGDGIQDGFDIGVNSAGSAFVWQYESAPLQFATNNTIRMTMLANGDIGIGTTTPTANLDLHGTFQYVDGNESNGYVLTTDNSGNATWQAPITGGGGHWDTLNSNLYTTSFPNVGVGTNDPQSTFHVSSSSGEGIPVNTTNLTVNNNAISTNSAGLSIIGGSNSNSDITFGDNNNAYMGLVRYNNTSNSLSIWTNNSADRIFIDQDGRVGLNTNSPNTNSHLHINSNTVTGEGIPGNADQLLINHNVNSTDNAGITIVSGSGGGGSLEFGDFSTGEKGVISYQNGTNDMTFVTNSNERIRINGNGHVGIGTTTPTARLTITETGGGNNGEEANTDLLLEGADPQIKFSDNSSGFDDWWIQIESENLFFRKSDNNPDGPNTSWDNDPVLTLFNDGRVRVGNIPTPPEQFSVEKTTHTGGLRLKEKIVNYNTTINVISISDNESIVLCNGTNTGSVRSLTGGQDGKVVYFINNGGASNFTLQHNDNTFGQPIMCPNNGPYTLQPDEMATLVFHSGKWFVTGNN